MTLVNVFAMWTPAFIIGYLLTLAVDVAGTVLIALSVYNDAKSKWNPNAAMWAVLVGLLGLIPGIIYLCTRNEPLRRIYVCQNCGWGNPLSARQCGHCGTVLYYPTEETFRLQKKAKTFLIIGIILWALAIIGMICVMVYMFQTITPTVLRGRW